MNDDPRTLRFATYLAPSVRPAYEAIAAAVGASLGIPTELAIGRGYERLATGDEDAAFICGLPYVRLADVSDPVCELLVAPVLAGERYEARPIYFSDVIVRADDPARGFADLRGRSWAFNEPGSHSGYGITRTILAARGLGNGFFGRVVRAGFHQRAIQMVVAGEVDASAIDSQVLELAFAADPALPDALRVIDVWGPSTVQPVVAARRLDRGLIRDLTASLEAVCGDPAARRVLRDCGIDRLVPVADSDYDDIRAMAAAAEAAGIVGLGTPETGPV